MDIMLDNTGDLLISKAGDTVLGNSLAQKIRIKLLWFEREWRWNMEEGMPYIENLFVKNPDTDTFESIVREKIFEVEEVTDVKDVSIVYDNKSRVGTLRYTAITDQETIKEEVKLK